ncbi:hypothetical protein EDB85DRAFT_1935205 [Lactarius pseudohatsudake]|nr:hypothetical protein EDB85DRAFT_1935205 [Lactarius pseudohatsudake]
MLFHMVHSIGVTNALVLISPQTTQRLVQLFELFEAVRPDSQRDAAHWHDRKPVVLVQA